MVLAAAVLPAVAQTASLHGEVTDESGALVPAARVTLGGASGPKVAVAGGDGRYSFSGLAPGNYTVQASAPDLAMPAPLRIALQPGARTLNLQLKVAAAAQKVTVEDRPGPALSADASGNASAVILRGEDLQALSDNPEDLEADLLALAGPSAGPNGSAIYIDGFSGGQLPPKESIREVRINQNPFSPEYDKLGFGRIEIFTKPGADKFKGTAFYNFGHDAWNTRNPYAAEKAPFFLQEYGANVTGPVNRRSSFVIDLQHHPIDNGAIINGITLDPQTLAIVSPYSDTYTVAQRRWIASPRVDYQLSANHTLVARYNYTRSEISGAGVGSFNLPERGTDLRNTAQTVQLTETAVIGARVINETRFQFFRTDSLNRALSAAPALQVLGSFSAGGSPVGRSSDTQNNFEFQNYTSVVHGKHMVRFGARLRGETADSEAPQNFNGTFTFGGGEGITSIERYRRTLLYQRQGLSPQQIRALGGGATQFTISTGNPFISGNQVDAGLFAGDDWRVRPNLTVSLGLRYETQSNIHDWRDLAPRIGVAWAPGQAASGTRPKSVVRAGFGMFYDRFGLGNTLAARRYNGIVQQQYVIDDPDFFPPAPPLAALGGTRSAQTVQRVSATLRAPYVMQPAVGFERQLPFNTTAAVTYAQTHGLHMLRSEVLPGPVFLMGSSGLYNQNQLIANITSRVNRDVSLFGSYVLNRARSNTDGLSTFPANPRDYTGEYGPAATDVHNRITFGGSLNAKWNVRLSPLLVAESGPPFDITAGRDVFGTTLFNGRPGIATDPARTGVIATAYGLLDPDPLPGERVLPRNYGRGPGSVALNLRVAKTIAFGGRGEGNAGAAGLPGGGDRRATTAGTFGLGGAGASSASILNRHYNLVIAMSIRNLLNHNNPGEIIGNITSPLFGQANQPAGSRTPGGTGFSEAANNRRLELQVRFTF